MELSFSLDLQISPLYEVFFLRFFLVKLWLLLMIELCCLFILVRVGIEEWLHHPFFILPALVDVFAAALCHFRYTSIEGLALSVAHS